MSKRWLPALLAAVALGAVPGVCSAQYYRGGGYGYSPYNYARHGSYWEPNYYNAYNQGPQYDAGINATTAWGDAYSPYYYSRHGSYTPPYSFNSYNQMPAYAFQPNSYDFGQPSYTFAQPASTPSFYYSPSLVEGEEAPANAANRAFIQVQVPANAEVWIEGDKTSQTGPNRAFASPPLQTGKSFTYDVRARWTGADGKAVDRTKQVKVQAGQRSTVSFSDADAREAVKPPKPDVKPDVKPDAKPLPKPDTKPDVKPDTKPPPKPDTPPPDTKPLPRPDTKVKPDTKPEPKPVPKPDTNPDK